MRHIMTPEQREAVAEYLRETRQQLRWTQPEAAARAGISVPMLAILERGHKVTPSEATLLKLAQGYEIDATELLRRGGYTSDAVMERGQTWNKAGRRAALGLMASNNVTPEVESGMMTAQSPGVTRDSEHTEQDDINEALDWAITAIDGDKTYPLNPQLKDPTLPAAVKALVVRHYQEQRGRPLLSADEMSRLNDLIHGGDGTLNPWICRPRVAGADSHHAILPHPDENSEQPS